MGIRKLKTVKVEDKTKRHVIKNKRRQGLLKKAVELSIMCDQEIILIVNDKELGRVHLY
jgi:hypothetical protein